MLRHPACSRSMSVISEAEASFDACSHRAWLACMTSRQLQDCKTHMYCIWVERYCDLKAVPLQSLKFHDPEACGLNSSIIFKLPCELSSLLIILAGAHCKIAAGIDWFMHRHASSQGSELLECTSADYNNSRRVHCSQVEVRITAGYI